MTHRDLRETHGEEDGALQPFTEPGAPAGEKSRLTPNLDQSTSSLGVSIKPIKAKSGLL